MQDPNEAAPQIHHPDAGEVGETGEHGELGTNAIDHTDRLIPQVRIGDPVPSGPEHPDRAAQIAKVKADLIAMGVSEEKATLMADAAGAIADDQAKK